MQGVQAALDLPLVPTRTEHPVDAGPALVDVTFCVVDLETTGGNARTDRITEVGAVKVRGGERIGQFATLVHPGQPIPSAITAITGIADHHVAGHPGIAAVLPAWLAFSRGTVLVAHSARFDVGFLDAALERHGYPTMRNPVVDTVALARRLVRDEVRNLRLATLATHLRARTSPIHRALPDALATVDVLHALLERAGDLGASTLPELQDLCRVTSLPSYQRIDLVRGAPKASGVYRFVDARGEVLYIGKAVDLRARLRTYFGQDPRRRTAELVRRTAVVEWDVLPTGLEAEVREVRAIGHHRPAYNRRSRHPEKRVHLAFSVEPFPRVVLTSAGDAAARSLLGPLPRRVAAVLAEAVTAAYDLRTCTDRLRRRADHAPCVLKELGRCRAPCDGTQSHAAYATTVAAARHGIAADPDDLLDRLLAAMQAHAAAQRFERAEAVREQHDVVAARIRRWRRVRAVARLPRLVAARPSQGPDHGWDVVELRHGRVRTSWWQRHRPEGGPLDVDLPDLVDQTVDVTEVEELDLVVRWLDGPGLHLLTVDGVWDEPIAGGARLAAVARAHEATVRPPRRRGAGRGRR